MVQLTNILCPVDFHPPSERAVAYAVAVARIRRAILHLVHVVSPVVHTSYQFPLTIPNLGDALEEAAREKMDRLEGEAGGEGVEVHALVLTGDIDEELQWAVQECHADIVIMGAHGQRSFERWFLGSVTERLLRDSPVPVLTVSDIPNRVRVPPGVNKVLLTTDFSQGTSEAIQYALALFEGPAEIILLHVVEDRFGPASPVEGVTQSLDQHLSDLIPGDVRVWCRLRSQVEVGNPYERILALADDEDVDLIVMNIQGKGRLERKLLGSTAERVLRGSECPVLAVPAVESGKMAGTGR